MRCIIVLLTLLFAALAMAQPPRYHRSSESLRYPVYHEPLWKFTHYPRGIPKAGERKPSYTYYPYSPYRSSYPRARYDRNKVQRYPVR